MDEERKDPAEWAQRKGVLAHVLAGLRHLARWAKLGEAVTEEQFDAAQAAYLEHDACR